MQCAYTPFIGNDPIQHGSLVVRRRFVSLAEEQVLQLQFLVGVVHVDFPFVLELRDQLEWDRRKFASRLGTSQQVC
jgi:hypothetical protein